MNIKVKSYKSEKHFERRVDNASWKIEVKAFLLQNWGSVRLDSSDNTGDKPHTFPSVLTH